MLWLTIKLHNPSCSTAELGKIYQKYTCANAHASRTLSPRHRCLTLVFYLKVCGCYNVIQSWTTSWAPLMFTSMNWFTHSHPKICSSMTTSKLQYRPPETHQSIWPVQKHMKTDPYRLEKRRWTRKADPHATKWRLQSKTRRMSSSKILLWNAGTQKVKAWSPKKGNGPWTDWGQSKCLLWSKSPWMTNYTSSSATPKAAWDQWYIVSWSRPF